MGPTAALGAFAADCARRDLPTDVLDKSALCLMDGFGLATIAYDEATTRAMRSLIEPAASDRGAARLWSDGKWAALSEATEANALAAHAHFHDDSEYASWTHPGSLIVPVAVTLGEATGADVTTILRAVTAGYAATHWLGADEEVALALIHRGVRTSPTLGAIGAAATAATLLGLNAAQAANAVAMATTICGGLLEPVRTGSDEWRLQNAHAARGGLRAAQLARLGVLGAPTALEGPKGFLSAYAGMSTVPARWGQPPDPVAIVTHVAAKPFASLGDNMAAVIAAKLLHDDGVDVADIEAINITLWRHYAEYPGTDFRGPFTKTAQALASTVFAAAAMLTCGELEYDINRDRREDPDILRLAALATIEPDDVGGPEDSVITLTLKDGTTLRRSAQESPRTLLFHDRATGTGLLEARLAHAGRPKGTGTAMADALFAQIDGAAPVTLRSVLDPVLQPGAPR